MSESGGEKTGEGIKELYSNVIEKASDGIVIIQDMIIKYGNPALEKIRGDSLKNILNHKFMDYIAPEERKKIKDYYRKRFKGKNVPMRYETVLIKKDESRIYVELNAGLIQYKGRPADLVIIRDITERKKAEEKLEYYRKNLELLVKNRTAELEKQKTFFNSIVENIPNMIFVKDAKELKFELFNKAGEKLLGQKRKDLIGKNDYDFFPKKQADFFTNKDRDVLKRKKPLDIPEEPIKTPSGERILHTQKMPIMDKTGKPIFLLGISEDITKRKEAEKRYKELFENAIDAIFIADPITKRILDCNKFAEKLMGYSRKKILSMYANQLHPKDKEKETMNTFEEQLKGRVRSFLTEVLTKDKKRIPVSINASIVRVGNKDYAQGIFRDISKEKEAEEKYKSIVESIKQGLYTSENGRFVEVNPAMSDIFGYSRDELLKMFAWELAKPKIREIVKEKFFAKVKNEDYSPETVECMKKDGKHIFVEISISKTISGKASGLVTDVTAKREAEIMKTEFISAISHELRTPITPIKAQLQRMISTALSKEEQNDSLEVALRNTIRMDRLIQDLLEMSRIQSGKFSIYRKKENLCSIIEEAVVDLSSFAKEKNTTITFRNEKIPEINIDRDRILEVIINLLDNAIKYGKGKVFIETKKEGGTVLMKIRDNGIGIPKEEIGKVFSSFYRGKKIEIQKYEGTGLGLSISRGIVEAHGGKIWAESKGEGATFFVRFPIR